MAHWALPTQLQNICFINVQGPSQITLLSQIYAFHALSYTSLNMFNWSVECPFNCMRNRPEKPFSWKKMEVGKRYVNKQVIWYCQSFYKRVRVKGTFDFFTYLFIIRRFIFDKLLGSEINWFDFINILEMGQSLKIV